MDAQRVRKCILIFQVKCESPGLEYNGDLHTALRRAVASGDENLVQVLLDRGANANHSNGTNPTLIFLAIDADNVNILKLLITYGANIEQCDEQGCRPLMHAAWNGKIDMVSALLTAGTSSHL